MRELLSTSRQRLKAFLTAYVSVGLVIGFVLSAACLWLFAELAEGIRENNLIVAIDVAISNALHTGATPGLIRLFLIITLFGSQVVWGLSFLLGLYYIWRRQWFSLLIWIVTLGGGELLNAALKLWFGRARPVFDNPIVVERFFSFPSGHAMMSMIAYGMLAYFAVLRIERRAFRLLVWIVAFILIALVGFSRIYLGVHYPSDVVAGFAAGSVWLLTCIAIREYVVQRLKSRREPVMP